MANEARDEYGRIAFPWMPPKHVVPTAEEAMLVTDLLDEVMKALGADRRRKVIDMFRDLDANLRQDTQVGRQDMQSLVDKCFTCKLATRS